IWCILLLGGWLAWSGGAAGPGAVIRIDLGTIDHAVSTALNESDVLQKMAEEAAKKKPNAKPIKGISGGSAAAGGFALKAGGARLVSVTPGGNPRISGGSELALHPADPCKLKARRALAPTLAATSRLRQDSAGIPSFSARNCHVALISVKTNLPSSMLPKVLSKFLDSTLQKVLPGLLCPAMDAVLDLLNAKLTTMTSEIPLGTAGTLQYALLNPPEMNETFIELDLKTILHQKEGKEVDLPTDQPSLASLPPKRDAATQLILSADFLSAELSVLQASFNLNISNNMVAVTWDGKGMSPLRFDSPQISRLLPPSQPVVVEMREAKAPVVTMSLDKSFVQLFSTAEFWVSPSDSSAESLFVLDVHSNLEAQFTVAEEKLQLSLALQRATGGLHHFSVFQELPLKGVLADILHVAYVPSIN
ncbi:BPI fold-containing family B member 6, partial [Opisthocomus hoazin]